MPSKQEGTNVPPAYLALIISLAFIYVLFHIILFFLATVKFFLNVSRLIVNIKKNSL